VIIVSPYYYLVLLLGYFSCTLLYLLCFHQLTVVYFVLLTVSHQLLVLTLLASRVYFAFPIFILCFACILYLLLFTLLFLLCIPRTCPPLSLRSIENTFYREHILGEVTPCNLLFLLCIAALLTLLSSRVYFAFLLYFLCFPTLLTLLASLFFFAAVITGV
jgi:hypothetical protein